MLGSIGATPSDSFHHKVMIEKLFCHSREKYTQNSRRQAMAVSLTEEQWSTYSGGSSNAGGPARRSTVSEHGKVPLESTTPSSSMMPSWSQPQQMNAQKLQQQQQQQRQQQQQQQQPQPQQQIGGERNFAPPPSFGTAPRYYYIMYTHCCMHAPHKSNQKSGAEKEKLHKT
jgi:hypothetical protein